MVSEPNDGSRGGLTVQPPRVSEAIVGPGEHLGGAEPLFIAVPNLASYHPRTGIGRVLQSLMTHWGERVRLVNASFKAHGLPVLRNLPYGVNVPSGTDLVLLPKLTGAEALRDTQGVPSLVIVHDIGVVDFPGDRQASSWLSHQAVMRSFQGLRYASHIVAVSRFTRDRLLHHLPDLEGCVSVVPNGVSDTFLDYCETRGKARERIEAILGTLSAGPILIYVGSEIPRKNVSLLLQVLKRVKRHYPEVQLLKVGNAGHPRWRKQTLEVLRRLDLELDKDVLLLEHVDDQTLADAYHVADVFVSTSLYEGFGLPALEAMAVGTPVVVSRRAALPEVAGGIGWTVEPAVEPFVRAVDAALSGSRAKAQELHQARAAHFNWQRSADAYLETIQSLCRQSEELTL